MQFTAKSLIIILLIIMAFAARPAQLGAAETLLRCEPTVEDEMGPFYKPDAPRRNKVGTGYLLLGTVKAASDCRPIPGAKIELWMTGPDGRYGDNWRATLFSADNGTYYFVSHTPTDFGQRRPHIHIRVTASGFTPLVTQHYYRKDTGEGLFDLVLTTSD